MINEADYPHLVQFFGGYFNQDEVEDTGSWQDLVASFLAKEPRATVAAVLAEIEALLNDGRLRLSPYAVLSDLACDYEPAADHLTPVEWLGKIREDLSRAFPGC